MAKTIALLTVHGMGDTPRNYHVSFCNALRSAVGKVSWDRIAFQPVYYQDVLQSGQAQIFERMRKQIDWMKLRRFLLYGFSDAASLEYKKELPGSPYHAAQQVILNALDAVFDEAGQNAIPVVIVAQSLGGHVLSSYLWDAQQQPRAYAGVWSAPLTDGIATGSPRDRFRRLQTLRRFYTAGCNIPIFVAGQRNIQAIAPPGPDFAWYNFFDEDDVLGWPLKPLSPSYEKLVQDIAINAGTGAFGTLVRSWNPFSHDQYWLDREFIDHLRLRIEALA